MLLLLENNEVLARQKEAQPGFPREGFSKDICAKLPYCGALGGLMPVRKSGLFMPAH